MKQGSKDVIKKIWKVVIHPVPAHTGELIFRTREELVMSLRQIGLTEPLILLLFLRGLIVLNTRDGRSLVQLIEIIEKVKTGGF